MFTQFQFVLSDTQNNALEHAYYAQKASKNVVKTHHINGRFENIYLPREQLPNLPQLLDEAVNFASQVLENKQPLKVGFWFNEMQAGDTTSANTHEEDDELLSGVYYIKVPKNSGDLVLGDKSKGDECVYITPKAGEFIFFSPKLLHAVEVNQSSQARLSIGMNFGAA